MSVYILNGEGKPRIVVVKATNTYVSVGATTFTATSVVEAGSPSLVGIVAGQRITSFQVIGGQPNKPVYAKILSVDDPTDKIVVDEWIGGTPTNSQIFTVNGWVIDLPRTQEMTERFTPDTLIHSLWRSRKAVKQYGWLYLCVLDYAQYIAGETLRDMQQALNLTANDKLILIPRADVPQFQYNVFFSEPIELSKYGLSKGYRKAQFVFEGKEGLGSFPIISGYGSSYATNYGINL